jgi:hypothetical protein
VVVVAVETVLVVTVSEAIAVMSAPLAVRPSTSERPASTSTVCVKAAVSVSAGCGVAGAIVCVAASPLAASRRQAPSASARAA